jgi:hypothetical protein
MSGLTVNLGIAPEIDFEALTLNAAADISLSTPGLDLSNQKI